MAALFFWSAVVSADPRPEMRGNHPPPSKQLTVSATALIGPLAPVSAREWLTLIAPSFSWADPESLGQARLTVSSRDFASLAFDDSTSHDTQTVAIRLYREGRTTLVAVSETGACCCGSCIARVHFFQLQDDSLIDVTDGVWPRFPFVTKEGLVSELVTYELARRGPYVLIRDRLAARVVYRLQRSPESGRFDVVWRRKGAAAPYGMAK